MTDCDVAVIGSGMGGLGAALALARAGRKVVVLEKHSAPGGWSHRFLIDGHRFSPGVHYIGQLQEGGSTRQTFEGLGLGEGLSFFELNRDGYDHIRGDGIRFDFPAGRRALENALCEKFPGDAGGIRTFLKLSNQIYYELETFMDSWGSLDPLSMAYRMRHIGWRGLFSVQHVLRALVKDPAARRVLSAQCGDHGMKPSRAILALHAGVQGHYREGGWYPRGGGGGLAAAFCRAIRASGGRVQLNARVDRILTDGRGVLGVRLADGTEVRADQVVSNADPEVTFRRLIGEERLPGGVRRKLRRTKWSSAAVIVFFAVDADVRALGLDSGNYWLSSVFGTPQDPPGSAVRTGGFVGEDFPWVFLSVSSLKDPTSFDGRHHTCEAFTFVPFEVFSRFEGTPHGNRPADYAALKNRIADEIMGTIERHFPGLTRHVVLREVGSPLTSEYYCESTHGACYGTEKSLWQLGPFAWKTVTPFRGLTLCGASTLSYGIAGAVQSGLSAAANILGCPPAALLRSGQPKIRTDSAEGLPH